MQIDFKHARMTMARANAKPRVKQKGVLKTAAGGVQ